LAASECSGRTEHSLVIADPSAISCAARAERGRLTHAPDSSPLACAMRLLLWQVLVGLGAIAGQACRAQATDVLVPASDPRVEIMGRVDRSHPDQIRVGFPGVTFRVRFNGPSLRVRVACSTDQSHVAVLVDGGAPRVLRLAKGSSDVSLAAGLGAGEHSLELVHRTETWQGVVSGARFLACRRGEPASACALAHAAPAVHRRLGDVRRGHRSRAHLRQGFELVECVPLVRHGAFSSSQRAVPLGVLRAGAAWFEIGAARATCSTPRNSSTSRCPTSSRRAQMGVRVVPARRDRRVTRDQRLQPRAR